MPVPDSKTEVILQGISASPGIALGPAFVYRKAELEVPEYQISPEKQAGEIERFNEALMTTRGQISSIRDQVEKNLGSEEAQIFDAHLMVLEDQALISETEREMETTGKNVEACFNTVAHRYIRAFAEIDDEYLRERAGDIRDVASRVLHNLMGQTAENLSTLLGRRIVVADDIAPSDAATLDRSSAMGIITESGSKTSHAVIVARSMKVPAVVGARGVMDRIKDGAEVIVDGYDGVIIIHPSEQTLYRYGALRNEKRSFEKRLMDAVHEPCVTQDGVAVALRAFRRQQDRCVVNGRGEVARLEPGRRGAQGCVRELERAIEFVLRQRQRAVEHLQLDRRLPPIRDQCAHGLEGQQRVAGGAVIGEGVDEWADAAEPDERHDDVDPVRRSDFGDQLVPQARLALGVGEQCGVEQRDER